LAEANWGRLLQQLSIADLRADALISAHAHKQKKRRDVNHAESLKVVTEAAKGQPCEQE
jgi:hypothetical protein